jgi:hypothetical protein
MLDKDKLVMKYFLELDNNILENKDKKMPGATTPGKNRQLTP